MRAVARAVVGIVEKKRPVVKVLSWEEHVAHGHIPFRKDCWLCQESSAKGKPHKRLGKHVRGGVLSVDTTGPLTPGEDVTGKGLRFLVVGAFTWVVPKGSSLKEDRDVEGDEVDLPEIDGEEEYEEENQEKGDDRPKRGRPRKMRPSEEEPDDDEEVYRRWQEGEAQKKKAGENLLEEVPEEREAENREDPEEEAENHDDQFEVKVFWRVVPVKSKRGDEVLQAVVDMIMRRKADGFNVVQVHSDNGGEFTSAVTKRWMFNRGYMRTYTAGDDPQSNGRAENSVQQAKSQIRRLLQQGGLEASAWPIAARHLNEVWRYQRIGKKQDTQRRSLGEEEALEQPPAVPNYGECEVCGPKLLESWPLGEERRFVVYNQVLCDFTSLQPGDSNSSRSPTSGRSLKLDCRRKKEERRLRTCGR